MIMMIYIQFLQFYLIWSALVRMKMTIYQESVKGYFTPQNTNDESPWGAYFHMHLSNFICSHGDGQKGLASTSSSHTSTFLKLNQYRNEFNFKTDANHFLTSFFISASLIYDLIEYRRRLQSL
jgi:hypothetical protein